MATPLHDFPLTLEQISALSSHSRLMVMNGDLYFLQAKDSMKSAHELADMVLDSSRLRDAARQRSLLID